MQYNTTDILLNQKSNNLPPKAQLLPFYNDFYVHVLLCLGYSLDNLPLGALLARLYQQQGRALVISPVHYQTTHNDAMIIAEGEALFSSSEDVKNAFHALSYFLKEMNLNLHFHSPSIWLLTAPDLPPIYAKSIYSMQHKSMMPEFAILDNTLYWQTRLTEIQMFFKTLSLKNSLNGVWIWGDGSLALHSRKVLAEEEYLNLAHLISSHAHLFDAEQSCAGKPLLLLKDKKSLSSNQLTQIYKTTSLWYWQDRAYTLPHTNKLAYFWSKWFHAN